jgi:hypothetical protein
MTVGAGFACQKPMVAFMKSTSGRWKTDPLQPVKRIGLIGCSVVCGILELFALQRSRYLARRARSRSAWNR